jgi:chromatin remodeling complex protein RSC6
MNAKLTINDTEFDFNGNKLKLKCNQNSNLNIKNIAKFDNLNANSIRINNFNISGNSNNIEIEYTGNASVNISYNAINDIQHSSIYKEPCIMQTENPLLTQNNNINLLMDENITDPVSKLIERNRKAKRERMQKFGIICYENYHNLSNENKEEILNINFKLVKANNELLKLLNQTSYTLKSKSDKNWKKIITRIYDTNKIIKRQYNTIGELIEINRENIKLFCKYEKLQKSLEEYKNKLLKKVSQEGYILKKEKRKYNRAPSGFCKPTYISNELATFLGKSIGTQMSRVDVSREINCYIRVNKLQDKFNGRIINCDDKLRILLKLQPIDELTYFNLQKFMNIHFKKPTYISNELATFLGKSIGTEMSKLEVSREINYYIRVNNLQVGRKINCDTKLRNLLRLKPTDELSYFNLQQFLDPHFKKAETTASSNPFSRQSLW